MSLSDGIKAMNLEMSDRIPRTEYSLDYHYELQREVTGIDVFEDSSKEIKKQAIDSLNKRWNLDFFWGVDVIENFYGEYYTKMGHAEYASDGSDYNNDLQCPFASPEQVLSFDPIKTYGIKPKAELIDFFNMRYQNRCRSNPGGINTTGTYTSFISGAITIFGWDMFLMALGTDMDRCGQMMMRYADYMMQYYEALAESDVPYIMVHDDIVWTSGPFVQPEWYRKYVFPSFKRYLEPMINKKKKVLFTSDGNFNEFIDDIADCGFHGFVLEPITDLKYIVDKYGKTHVIIGNADTRILLNGTKEEIYKETKRCMDLGRECPGFFMAVGNHIPANTPVENAIYYNECYEKMSKRK